jgi:hypothetical protein
LALCGTASFSEIEPFGSEPQATAASIKATVSSDIAKRAIFFNIDIYSLTTA